jgi:hypothetical protein
MVTAILSFLGSVISALPKLLEMAGSWRRDKAIAEDQANKDNRNAAAIREATKPTSGPSV